MIILSSNLWKLYVWSMETTCNAFVVFWEGKFVNKDSTPPFASLMIFDIFFCSFNFIDPFKNLGYLLLWGLSDFVQNDTWYAENEGM